MGIIDPAEIQEQMAVVDSAGFPIGTALGVEGDLIRLTRAGAADGVSHFLPLARIERIADGRLWLRNIVPDEGTGLNPEALAAGYHGQGAPRGPASTAADPE